jgi:CRISPR-associated exonuclease Cas4
MYSESDLLPLSGLQHLAYCERQWALIHLEQQWAENQLTAEGRQLHERTHESGDEIRDGVRICRGLRLRSLRLGLVGQADVVELHPGPEGSVMPFPIEYKRGRPKPGRWDEVQLCAQALCLEEMLRVPVSAGAFFYGQPRRRTEVRFDTALRSETEALAARLHELNARTITPPAEYAPKCHRCSLREVCLPEVAGARRNVSGYLRRAVLRTRDADIGPE